MLIGYKRVSTDSQNTDRQLDGINLEKIYEDKKITPKEVEEVAKILSWMIEKRMPYYSGN